MEWYLSVSLEVLIFDSIYKVFGYPCFGDVFRHIRVPPKVHVSLRFCKVFGVRSSRDLAKHPFSTGFIRCCDMLECHVRLTYNPNVVLLFGFHFAVLAGNIEFP